MNLILKSIINNSEELEQEYFNRNIDIIKDEYRKILELKLNFIE